ncbi:MAG: AsmA-like C-terminal region-containing protein [Bacteroidia bacterium]
MTTEEPMSSAPVTPRRPNRFLRFLWRLFIFVMVSIILLLGSGALIGYFYQDEVKEYVIGELNKQLNTEIIVDGQNIDFTVIKSFPYASVEFKKVKALEAVKRKNKDTLFTAGAISFQFNLFDIFKKNYRIKKIAVTDADMKVRIDKEGNDNYHFWKESSDSSNASFAFSLEHIDLKNVHLSWKDQRAHQNIDVTLKKSSLSGNFSDRRYSLETESDLYVERIKIDSTNYLRKKNIHAAFSLDVDNTTPSYKIKEGSLKIENLLFQVFGNVVSSGNEPVVNFGVKGKDMDIQSVLSLIPSRYLTGIKDYGSDGEFYFDATIQGVVSSKEIPRITADFGIKDADITQVKDDIRLHHVNLKGHYFNGNKNSGEASVLTLDPFSAVVEQGSIEGKLTLKNLDSPAFSGNVKADLKLDELQRFFHIDTIASVTGGVKLNAAFDGNYADINAGRYGKVTTSGDLQIRDANLTLKNYSLEFIGMSGDFKFDNNDLAVNSFSGKAGSSDFLLKGFFRNMIGFAMTDDEDITVEATLNSDNINLNELLANKAEDSKSESKYKLKFSEHIDANLNSDIGHLVFRKFDATNIHGVVKLKDKKLIADPVTLNTMSGTITTSGMIDGTDSTKLLVTCFSDVNRINITKMFTEFENFGQSAVTDQNLKGVATAKIQFASVLSPGLEMDPDKLYAGVDVTIENGEMNNVEVMKSLSRFIELKDLENIRFSTLKNQIEVKNKVITIPRMEVKSNAINIIASGTHTFDNEINYKVKLSLNELLSKKAKNAKKENDEFGQVADDGLGRTNIFLSMTGTVDNPVIKYDSKSAIQNVRSDLKVEKQTLKGILKEEFGLFKKDSTAKVPQKEDPKFIIKWEESDKKEEKKELKKPKKPEEDDY